MQDRIAYQGITFDDVLLEPGYSDVLPKDVDVRTQLSRNMFYNPGFQNWNAGLFKDFHTTEHQYLTFRAESFNFLNHLNWNGADTNPNSKTFGQVTNKDSNQPNRALQLSLRYTF